MSDALDRVLRALHPLDALPAERALNHGELDDLMPPTLREAIRRSWQLNCALDSGTCPPQVARITEAIEPFGAAYKLLGAGGGGYLLILAPDLAAAAGIKDALLRHPPNPQARFVAMAVSRTGMQITRS